MSWDCQYLDDRSQRQQQPLMDISIRQSQEKSTFKYHLVGAIADSKCRLYITFIDKEGDEHKIAVSKGDNLLTIAQAHDIEMEGKHIPYLPP